MKKKKKKLTREEVVMKALRSLVDDGEAVRRTVDIVLATGSVITRTFYKVKPLDRRVKL
jgi:hypothetical protein